MLAADVKRLKQLRQLAEKATPGPWFLSMSNQVVRTLDPEPKAIAKFVEDDIPNAQFISAANPEAVLGLLNERSELIARIDELSARCAKLEAALQFYADENGGPYAPGDYHSVDGGKTAREALKDEADEPRRGES